MPGSRISPRTSIPPPMPSPFKQWENTLGVIPWVDNCDITESSPWPNPKIPSTALSVIVKSPDWKVLHLFSTPPSSEIRNIQKRQINLGTKETYSNRRVWDRWRAKEAHNSYFVTRGTQSFIPWHQLSLLVNSTRMKWQ